MELLFSLILSSTIISISFDPGGRIDEYTNMAYDVLEHDIQVQITGECYSACTLFADLARDNVCITTKTIFFIHQATSLPSGMRSPVPYTPDLNQYIGEQPTEGWRTLTYPDLKLFWRTCP